MLKFTVLLAAVGILAMGVPSMPTSTAGSWQIDTRHSDAQLITDATTDYGKTKIDVTLGFARVWGRVNVDDANPAKSSVELHIYPATAMSEAIAEDGRFLNQWLANLANNTLVCFHSKNVVRLPDGRVQATGDLVLTRVDRNVEATASEAYAGPVYGPPMIHRVSREATFVFDLTATEGKDQKDGGILASGSTKMFREDYPQLLRAAVSTYWPVVVQDKTCPPITSVGEAYHGSECTGTMLEAPGLPEAPHAASGEDVGVPSNFNAVVGNRLNIQLHLHLTQKGSTGTAAGGY